MRGLKLMLFLAAVAALAACAPPAAQPSAELAATTETWETAFNAGDTATLTAAYAEDTRVMPPNGETVQGRAGVEAVFGAMIASGVKGKLENIEAVTAGDIGHKVGSYEIAMPDGTVVDRGKFVELWKQVDGQWLMTHDIWNSDLAAGAGTTTMVVTHEVQDVDRWLAAWQGPDSRHALFAQHGAPSVRVFRSVDKPTLTGLLIEVADMAALQAMLDSPEGAAAKAADGVKDPTIRMFAEVK